MKWIFLRTGTVSRVRFCVEAQCRAENLPQETVFRSSRMLFPPEPTLFTNLSADHRRRPVRALGDVLVQSTVPIPKQLGDRVLGTEVAVKSGACWEGVSGGVLRAAAVWST